MGKAASVPDQLQRPHSPLSFGIVPGFEDSITGKFSKSPYGHLTEWLRVSALSFTPPSYC
jgi:hypothetical protein